eukprot:2061818-Prymnesium_polylepis.1
MRSDQITALGVMRTHPLCVHVHPGKSRARASQHLYKQTGADWRFRAIALKRKDKRLNQLAHASLRSVTWDHRGER